MKQQNPGVLEALSRLGGSFFDILRTRLELASIEISEAASRLLFVLILSFVGVLLLAAAVLALSVWVALAWWSSLGPAVLAWLGLAYAAAGTGLLVWLRAHLRQSPPLLADTLAELRADAATMRGESS